MTASEMARWVQSVIAFAQQQGGGRSGCCSRGLCCLHLSEDHPAGGKHSTVHLGTGLACFPDSPGQELSGGAAREAYLLGLRVLGITQEDLR